MVTGCTKSSVAVFALAASTCVDDDNRFGTLCRYGLAIPAAEFIMSDLLDLRLVATARAVVAECAPLDRIVRM